PRPTVEAVELGKLERPQLVAMVQALRDEKESLLKQRAELQKALGTGEHGGDHPKRNYYRFEQEELLESAKKGEVRIRGPQIRAEGYTVKDSVRSDIGLTPDEGAKVEAIFARSTARVHDGLAALYQEIGGDPGSLSSQSMLEELRSKSLGSDYADAVRLLANVRAGLAAPPAPGTGSAISRAYFLFDAEDRRVIDELDALIGPARAEALLNHPDVGHSNNTFGVGPAPQGAKKP
ncbi:MAG: hypothetical protein K1X89_21385, partial [Myxococcaceae bacterium]|nr:hypothetical protein [Myxococcaceae bacterium]